ncbi:hypothetical protein ACI65C_000959 [Semiaphis heraclei]
MSTSDSDETLTLFPSLPVYSVSSNSSDSKKIGLSWMRFVVISLMSTAFLLQSFSQSIWSAIHEPALLAFPNWTSRSLSLLPIWGSLMTTVLVFPACLTINKYGLKLNLLWSCCFFTLGTAIRCMPTMHSCTMCLHLSAICQSVGGVEMTPLIITMSAQWFPKNERNMATGFCLAVKMLGSAVTYKIVPNVVSVTNNGPLKPFIVRSQIMHMLYACLALNVFVTLLVYTFFPRCTTPLSYESKLSIESHQSAKMFHSLKTLVTNLDFWCLVFAFTLSNTMSVPWAALIPSTFFKLHMPPVIRPILQCVVLMAFPYAWCTQSLLYEMGVEMMYPLPECFVAAYMTLSNNLFVDFVYVVLYFFPRFGHAAGRQ